MYEKGSLVRIRYRRPPDRVEVYEQRLVARDRGALVTLMDETPLAAPIEVGGATILEPGSPVLWFTFPELPHDVGRFHLRDGRFTGYYANVLTPVEFLDASTWSTTDHFVDVWLGPGGEATVLDRDELEDAVRKGWLERDTAAGAIAEAERIVGLARGGRWPPPVVREWTLHRARASLRPAGGAPAPEGDQGVPGSSAGSL